MSQSCVLCNPANEKLILQTNACRVILVDNQFYPGYIQVISNKHIKELTALDKVEALAIFDTIWLMEQRILQLLNPDKINIASLGNMVPHLHWHIIPRFSHDRNFPNSIWGEVTNPDYQPFADLFEKQNQLFSS